MPIGSLNKAWNRAWNGAWNRACPIRRPINRAWIANNCLMIKNVTIDMLV